MKLINQKLDSLRLSVISMSKQLYSNAIYH